MICRNCGSAIDDWAVQCIHCGAPTGVNMYYQMPDYSNEPANGGFIVLSLFVPIFGIVYGAVESGNGKKRAGKAYLTCGITGIIAWTVLPIIFSVFVTVISLMIGFLPLIPLLMNDLR